MAFSALAQLCTALVILCSITTTAWCREDPSRADYHVSVQTLLWLDSWRGFELSPVEQTEIWQRLRLSGFKPGKDPHSRTIYTVDIEVGTDLGPTGPRLRKVFDQRRARLDLHAAEIKFKNLWGRSDVRLGRQLFFDALGFDALDGMTLSALPWRHVRIDARGGLAVRRGWSKLGPDLFSPDGTVLQRQMGYVTGVTVGTKGLKKIGANISWRQHFDTETQRNELGASTQWRPTKSFSIAATTRADLLLEQISHGSARLHWGNTKHWLSPSWRLERPTFSADSIWYAFGILPYQAGRLAAGLARGQWTFNADGQLIHFEEQAIIADAHDLERPTVSDTERWSHDGGFSLFRRWTSGTDWARAGLKIRSAGGYGGTRHHGDLSLKLPLPIKGRMHMLWLRSHLGATWFEAPNRTEWNGLTAWGLIAGELGVRKGVNLEGSLEGFTGDARQRRVRGMARLKVENWW